MAHGTAVWRNSDPIKSIAAKTQTACVSEYGGHLQWRRGLERLGPVGDVEQAVATLTGLALPHLPIALSEPEVDGGHLGHDGRDLLRG